jgi:hypothetical protein
MTAALPLSITHEAADFIAEQGLQTALQNLLENIPQHIPNLHLGGGPCVILDVNRDTSAGEFDSAEPNGYRWVAENLSAEESQYFCLHWFIARFFGTFP